MHSRERHSALGIASCCVFLSGGVIAASIIAFWVYGPLKLRPGAGPVDFAVPVFGIAVGLILDIVALGLGIAGLCQKGRKRYFAKLGTVLSSLPLLAAFALWLKFKVDDLRASPPWHNQAPELKDTMEKHAPETDG
jgi:hypothetical protein